MRFERSLGGRGRGGLAALAMVIVVGAHGAARAEPAREPRQVVVSTAGVDFNDPASVAAFDRRLQWAAAAACDSGLPHSFEARLSDARCARESLARAVAQIDRPLLSKLHGRPMTMAMGPGHRPDRN